MRFDDFGLPVGGPITWLNDSLVRIVLPPFHRGIVGDRRRFVTTKSSPCPTDGARDLPLSAATFIRPKVLIGSTL